MKRCAFLTMDDPSGFFTYDHLACEPLARRGWQVDEIPWKSPAVSWNDYQLVVIRSPWDYQQDAPRFLSVLQQIDGSQARLENRLEIVRWNIDKTYLRDLSRRGVPIVPTRWLPCLEPEQLAGLRSELATNQLVLKPLIGANADDTFRLGGSADQTRIAIETFRNRPVMAQPFVESIVTLGEYSLFYFAGVYSHCIVKRPLPGDFRVQEEHGGTIRAATPDRDLLSAGQQAIDAVHGTLLYARVDLVRLPDGQVAVMELELIEPSLYFPYDPMAAERFADAVARL